MNPVPNHFILDLSMSIYFMVLSSSNMYKNQLDLICKRLSISKTESTQLQELYILNTCILIVMQSNWSDEIQRLSFNTSKNECSQKGDII